MLRNIQIIGLVLLVSTSTHAATRSAVQGRTHKDMSTTVKSSGSPSYANLLKAYKSSIDAIGDKKRQKRIDEYKQQVHDIAEQKLWIEGSTEDIEGKLRLAARSERNHKLDFDGEAIETSYIAPASDKSAVIFRSLWRENLLDPRVLISGLFNCEKMLSPGWIKLVQDMSETAGTDKPLYDEAALILYKAGISQEKYRPELLRMVRKGNNVSALRAILFARDMDTGESIAVRSSENDSIKREFSKPSVNPELRMICAEYAADTNDYTLAKSICFDILKKKYKALEKAHFEPTEDDYPLARAKMAALNLLFHKVKSEDSFRTVYDLSRYMLMEKQLEDSGKAPRGSKSTRFCPLVEMICGEAQSLIYEIDPHYHDDLF